MRGNDLTDPIGARVHVRRDEPRAVGGRRAERGAALLDRGHVDPGDAESCGELGVVERAERRARHRIALALLPSLDLGERVVGEDDDRDAESEPHAGFELGHRHGKAAVPEDARDGTRRIGELEPERGGKPVPHRRQSVRDEERPRPIRRPALRRHGLVVADVGGDESVPRQRTSQLGEDVLRGQAARARPDTLDERVAKRAQLFALALRPGLRTGAKPLQRDVDRPDELDLAAVVAIVVREDADVHDACSRAPVAVELDRVESDHQDQVTRIDVVVEVGRAESLDRPEEELVVFGEDALRLRTDHNRDAPRLGQCAERTCHRFVVRVHSHEEQRVFTPAQPRHRSPHGVLVDRRSRLGDKTRQRDIHSRLRGDVARDLDVHGTATRALGRPESAFHDRRGVRGRKLRVPLRDRREELAEVEPLMRRDLITVRRELTRERQDGRAIEVRVRDAGDEIGRTRAERGEAHAGNAGQRCAGLGHERGGRLVFGQNELEPRLAESLDEVDHLAAGMAVDVADAGRAQAIAYRAGDTRSHGDSMPPMWEGRPMKRRFALAFPVLLAIAACAQATAPSASPTIAPTTAPTVAATVAPTPTSPVPTVPVAVAVEVPVKGAALLVLDITNVICTPRASFVASVPKIAALIKKARDAKVPLIYSQTTTAGSAILPEVAPQTGEPSGATRADKFFNTNLDQLMKDRAVTTAVIVGSAANGAVLYTSFGANLRGYTVVVAEDGISGEPEFSVTLTRWQLLNQPGFANADNTPLRPVAVTLSSTEKISFK